MSWNRENVTWESADGTWSMAFYKVTWEGEVADGYDPEWDVEYDYSAFEPYNYATKCVTEDEAYIRATRNTSNPGGSYVVHYAGNYSECERYNQMLRDALAQVKA